MDALLIVNPHATTTTDRRRDLLTRALAGSVDLTVVHTTHRGHATELAARATRNGTAMVVVHGGDGTVNEVVNGLLVDGPAPFTPRLAVVPGGSTNVFARALGVAADPTEATEQILDGITRGRSRVISLGRADGRYFTFNTGLGLDAEVVRAVEAHRARGRAISNWLHIRRAVRAYLASDRRHPRLTVTVDGTRIDAVHLALVSNLDPWSYASGRPVRTNPGLPPDRGLGVLAVTRMRALTLLRLLRQLLWGRSGPHSPYAHRFDGAAEIVLEADEPIAFHVDGDDLGDRCRVVVRSVPQALRVIV